MNYPNDSSNIIKLNSLAILYCKGPHNKYKLLTNGDLYKVMEMLNWWS